MVKLKPSIKSLILSTLVVIINFAAYLTFRLFGFQEFNIFETLLFTGYVSILDFTLVFIASFIFFKFVEN